MRRIRQLTVPIQALRRHVCHSSGFRNQPYKRLDYPKAPSVLKSARDTEPVAEEFVIVKTSEKKTKKRTEKALKDAEGEEFVFGSEKEALEFSLAPYEEKLQRYETRLDKLHKEHREHLGAIKAEIEKNGGVYAVRRGLVPGIYLHWNKVAQETHKVVGSEWQKFDSVKRAVTWMGKYKVCAGDVCYDPYIDRIVKTKRLLKALKQQRQEEEKEETQSDTWYVVKKGRQPGIFTNWEDAADQVIGFKDAVYSKFRSKNEAMMFLGVSRREYFKSLRQDPKETDEEMVSQRRLRDEREAAYRREKQRVNFRNYFEADFYANPPKDGHVSFVKQGLGKLLQIQAEINKMVYLDKKRKYFVRNLFEEISQMTQDEKDMLYDEIRDNELLLKTYRLITTPEHLRFYKEFLDKSNYVTERNSEFWGESEENVRREKKKESESAFESREETYESREEASEAREPDVEPFFSTNEKFFGPSDVFARRERREQKKEMRKRVEEEKRKEVERQMEERKQRKMQQVKMELEVRLKEEKEKKSVKNADFTSGLVEDGSGDVFISSGESTDTFISSDGSGDTFISSDGSGDTFIRGTGTGEETAHYNPYEPLPEPENSAQIEFKENLVRRARDSRDPRDPASTVTLDDLAKLKCKCGEPIYLENDDPNATEPLVPRTFLYLDPQRYPSLHNDNGLKKRFRGNKQLFCHKTTSFRDHFIVDHHTAFASNWEVLHMALGRRLATLAAYYDRRYDNVDANKVYTDGSCNNFASEEGQAGWGVHFENFVLPDAYGRVPGVQTPQRAEIMAILMAVRIITRDLKESKSQHWEIRSDSLYVLRMIESGWNGLQPTNLVRDHPDYFLVKRLRELLLEHQHITLKWVGGRRMWVGAGVADKLAKKGSKMDYEETVENYGSLDEDALLMDPCENREMNWVRPPQGLKIDRYIPDLLGFRN